MNDTTPERWLPVPDYEGLYEVSSYGQVWSVPRATTRGGILKHIVYPNGYHFITLTRDGVQQRFPVHGLVMRAFTGPYPEGLEVRHLDGDPGNNRWAPGSTEDEIRAAGGNLIYGTHSENMRDKKEHGTEWQSNVTHCPKNHEYTPENTRILKSGSRACRECATIQSREWMRAHATRKDITMTCPHCEQEFERPLGQGARRYCSPECAKEAKREYRRQQRAAG
jgi:hypothetical protein